MKTMILLIASGLLAGQAVLAIPQVMVDRSSENDSTKVVKVTPADTVPLNDEFTELEAELNSIDSKKSGSDTTHLRIGNLKVEVTEDGDEINIKKDDDDEDKDYDWNWNDDHKKGFDPHWAGFSFGPNFYSSSGEFSSSLDPESRYMELNSNKSWEFNWYIADVGINLANDQFGIVTGLGIKWNNYNFSNKNLKLLKGADSLLHYTDTNNYEKSKLSVCSMVIPLLLEVDIPLNGQDLYLAAGVEGTVKLGAHTKMVTSSNKNKNRDDFYLNAFNYSLVARAGYNDWGFYASYGMKSLFKEDQGPELYPFAVGLSLNF